MYKVNKIIRLGNIYPSKGQNGEIYYAEGISPTISSRQGKHGNGIGSNNAPKIQINEHNEGNKKMKELTNNFKQYDFTMDKIKLFDSFAGIGALHQSLKELGVPVEIVGISEVNIDAIISYAGIHVDNFNDLKFAYPSEDEMRTWLMDRNIGWSFEKQKSSIPRLKKDKLYKVYKASILLNNLGDIGLIDYSQIEDFDVFNLSFACTDISMAGKQKGLVNEDGTPTRSGFVKYGIELIKVKRPKYIMIENVKGLIQKKFINDFYDIVHEIESYGYKCYYPTVEDKKGNIKPICLNAKDYGIPQNRERIFIMCIRTDIDDGLFQFPKGFDSGLRLKDFLEDDVDEKYYLNQECNDRFQASLNNKDVQNKIPHDVIMEELGTTQPKEIFIGAIRGRYNEDDKIEQQLELRNDENTNSLTTVQKDNVIVKRFPNPTIRKLTPKECWRLMGFRDECFKKAKDLGVSDSALYQQAGNSIVVNCLYYTLKELFKKYIEKNKTI